MQFTKRNHRTGVAAVEFALTVPILFAFLFAALEFTRGFMMLHTADNAAYEGARRGIVPGATSAQVQAEVQRVMGAVGARNVNIEVNPTTITNETDVVTVNVSVPMNSNSLISPVLFRNLFHNTFK